MARGCWKVGKPGELVFGLRFEWTQRKRRSVVAKLYLCSGLGSGGDKVQVPGGQNWRQFDSSTAGSAERERPADATPGAHSFPIDLADGPDSCLDKADLQLSVPSRSRRAIRGCIKLSPTFHHFDATETNTLQEFHRTNN